MDFFTFDFQEESTILGSGKPVVGVETALWIERYTDAGEFRLTGKLSSGILNTVSLGSVISHTKTLEVMIVENYELTEDVSGGSEVIISGRSFETILEKRVLGRAGIWSHGPSLEKEPLVTSSNPAWNTAKHMIELAITAPLPNINYVTIPNVFIEADIPHDYTLEPPIERHIRDGEAYQTILELLKIDKIGIKSFRNPSFSDLDKPHNSITLLLHIGSNKSATTIFSWSNGDIKRIKYLESIKEKADSVFISSYWFNRVLYLPEPPVSPGFGLGMKYIDASYIDDFFDSPPENGTERDSVELYMSAKAKDSIKNFRQLRIVNVDISENSRYKYRVDYNIGDIVGVDGSKGVRDIMRVIENAEVFEQGNYISTPTLASLED